MQGSLVFVRVHKPGSLIHVSRGARAPALAVVGLFDGPAVEQQLSHLADIAVMCKQKRLTSVLS